jgi:hypothetical protein
LCPSTPNPSAESVISELRMPLSPLFNYRLHLLRALIASRRRVF